MGYPIDMATTSYNPGPEASFKGPTTTQGKWASQDCRQQVQDLKKTTDKIFDKLLKRKDAQSKQVGNDFERRKSGGLMEQLSAGPLSEFKEKIAKASTDPAADSLAQRSFLNRFLSYLDMGRTYVGLTTDMVSGVVSKVVNEMDTVGRISEAAGMGSLMPSGQESQCSKSLLVGTVGSVVRIADSSLQASAQNVFTAQATLGLAMEALPDLYAGIMSMPAGTLSLLITNKAKILDEIDATVKSVIDISFGMEKKDYPADHKAFVRAALSNLESADSDLGQVEQTLEAGGKFLETNWDRAQTVINDTGEDLLSIGSGSLVPGFAFLKILQLLGYQKHLESLSGILAQREALFQQLVGMLGKFQTEFEASADFRNLAAPLIQQVRCVLQMIMADMEKTLDLNAILKYFIKEKQWGIELVQLAGFMKGTESLGKGLSKSPISSKDAANALSASIAAEADRYSQAESYDILNSLLSYFVKEIRRKIASNVDPAGLAYIGDAILAETSKLRKTDVDLAGLLGPFNDSMAKTGLAATQAVGAILEVFGDGNLDTFVDAVRRGDWKSLLGVNALKSQLESMARKQIGDLLQCCQDNAGDGNVQRRLTRMGASVQTLQRGKELYDKYTKGFSERYLKSTYGTSVPGIKQLKADSVRISSARCLTKGGETPSTESTSLTLV